MCFVIYKIELGKFYYYGSTDDIKTRLKTHKKDCFNPNNRKIYKHLRNIGITRDNFYEKIKPIIICSIRDCIEPRIVENKFINLDDKFCLNMVRAYRTEEEKKEYDRKYYNKNKEKYKKYRDKNKYKIKKYQNKSFDCECGGKYTQRNLLRHLRSMKHRKWLFT